MIMMLMTINNMSGFAQALSKARIVEAIQKLRLTSGECPFE